MYKQINFSEIYIGTFPKLQKKLPPNPEIPYLLPLMNAAL